jgi:hypothetical protein
LTLRPALKKSFLKPISETKYVVNMSTDFHPLHKGRC